MKFVINKTERLCNYCDKTIPKGKEIIIDEFGAYCDLECFFEGDLDNARELYYRGEV